MGWTAAVGSRGFPITFSFTPSGALNINGASNVLIENKSFTDLNGPAIEVRNTTNTTIRNCEFRRCGDGIYFGIGNVGPITVRDCYFEDMHPPGSIASFPGFPAAQAVQFDNVTTNGILIRDNLIDGGKYVDVISFHKSGGTAASPALVTRNRIRACRPGGICWDDPNGTGMALADSGGQYITSTENLLIQPGQVGMGIAGGHHCIMSRNIIYGRPHTGTGTVGMYVWDFGDPDPGGCFSHQVTDNRVHFFNVNGTPDNFFNGMNCEFVQTGNIFGDVRLGDHLWGQSWEQLLTLLP